MQLQEVSKVLPRKGFCGQWYQRREEGTNHPWVCKTRLLQTL